MLLKIADFYVYLFFSVCGANCASCITNGASKCDLGYCKQGFGLNIQKTCDREYSWNFKRNNFFPLEEVLKFLLLLFFELSSFLICCTWMCCCWWQCKEMFPILSLLDILVIKLKSEFIVYWVNQPIWRLVLHVSDEWNINMNKIITSLVVEISHFNPIIDGRATTTTSDETKMYNSQFSYVNQTILVIFCLKEKKYLNKTDFSFFNLIFISSWYTFGCVFYRVCIELSVVQHPRRRQVWSKSVQKWIQLHFQQPNLQQWVDL